jgi:hypothetical protein
VPTTSSEHSRIPLLLLGEKGYFCLPPPVLAEDNIGAKGLSKEEFKFDGFQHRSSRTLSQKFLGLSLKTLPADKTHA